MAPATGSRPESVGGPRTGHILVPAVAVFAIARKLATLVYRMLRYGQDYIDVEEQAYEAQFQHPRLASLAAAAQSPGYTLIQ